MSGTGVGITMYIWSKWSRVEAMADWCPTRHLGLVFYVSVSIASGLDGSDQSKVAVKMGVICPCNGALIQYTLLYITLMPL
jgi:hypothetical protein